MIMTERLTKQFVVFAAMALLAWYQSPRAFGQGYSLPKQTLDLRNLTGASDDVIDGAIHPELIPDLTAFRMFMVVSSISSDAVSPSQPLEERESNRQRHIGKLGLTDSESQTYKQLVDVSRAKYDKLINDYNLMAKQSASGPPDYAGFVAKRDALVFATWQQLRQALAVETMSKIEATVKQEKTHMRISKVNAAFSAQAAGGVK